MKYDLSKITENDIYYLLDLSRFHTDSINVDADPYGGPCPIDPRKAIEYEGKTRELGFFIEKFVAKIKLPPIIKKTVITAQEAKEYAKQNVRIEIVEKNTLSESLISTLMNRIKTAIEDGRSYITTAGINDAGNSVRGIGNYLSRSTLDEVITYFTGLGYNVVNNAGTGWPDSVYQISWSEDKPQTKLC